MKIRSGLIPLAFIATVVMTGCGDVSSSLWSAGHEAPAARLKRDRYEVTAQDIAPYRVLLKAHEHGPQRALRVKVDTARNRLWVLALEHVYIYDITGKQLIRQVVLPNRSVAGFVCSPDMALDRSGSAFISSNVESRLWKIDADVFGIKAQEITLQAGMDRDIGFGALTFAADGALYAVTAHEGSLWRIDAATLKASEVGLSERMSGTCTLIAPRQSAQSVQLLAVMLCAAAEKNVRRIVVSPDSTRGQVSTEKCP